MNTSAGLTLDDLSNLVDDLDMPVEHDDSPANTPMPVLAPLPAGKYPVRLEKIDFNRDQNGDIRDKQTFSADFKIVGHEKYDGRTIRFIPISGKSSTRFGTDKGQHKFVELFDLVHAYEPAFDCQGSLQLALKFLVERIADQANAEIYLDWKAFDSKYFANMNGDTMENGSQQKKDLYKACGFKGHQKFEQDGTVTNPASNNILKAKLYMRFAVIPKITN